LLGRTVFATGHSLLQNESRDTITSTDWLSVLFEERSLAGLLAAVNRGVRASLLYGVSPQNASRQPKMNENPWIQAWRAELRNEGVGILAPTLDRWRADVRRIYLHLDLDVLDPIEGRANSYAVLGGLSTQLVADCIMEIGSRFVIAAAGITAYDPSYDSDDRVLRSAFALTRSIVLAAAPKPSRTTMQTSREGQSG
jgi:hypothetical protein